MMFRRYIMKLLELLGIRAESEKIDLYKSLKNELVESFSFGEELAERYRVQKSIISDIFRNGITEEARKEAMDRYQVFLKSHQKEVAKAANNHNRILKSMEKLRNDSKVGEACREIDLLENLERGYREGKLIKSLYFDLVKSKTGKPVKYADVIVTNGVGKVLILHRAENFFPTGQVCIPGGHVDPGEDFEAAALRELREETNIVPVPGKSVLIDKGEYKTSDAHIHYYILRLDEIEPAVTVQAEECCMHEWVDYSELAQLPFIFDQGKQVIKRLNAIDGMDDVIPIDAAYREGKLSKSVHDTIVNSIFCKALDTVESKPLMPESMEGVKYVKFPARDVKRCIEAFMNGVGKCQTVVVNGAEVSLGEPVLVKSVEYCGEPENGRLCDVKIAFIGSEGDMRTLLRSLRDGFLSGNISARTSEEEFLSANLNGADYVGEPVFFES